MADAPAVEPASSDAQPLPEGWVRQSDGQGRTYYENAALAVTQWDPPSDGKDVVMPFGWEKRQAADGRTYFENPWLAVSQWNCPQRVAAPPQEGEAPLADGWVAYETTDGRVYFESEALSLTQWARPDSSLPAGWISLKAEDGRAYYEHVPSMSTQWEHPASVVVEVGEPAPAVVGLATTSPKAAAPSPRASISLGATALLSEEVADAAPATRSSPAELEIVVEEEGSLSPAAAVAAAPKVEEADTPAEPGAVSGKAGAASDESKDSDKAAGAASAEAGDTSTDAGDTSHPDAAALGPAGSAAASAPTAGAAAAMTAAGPAASGSASSDAPGATDTLEVPGASPAGAPASNGPAEAAAASKAVAKDNADEAPRQDGDARPAGPPAALAAPAVASPGPDGTGAGAGIPVAVPIGPTVAVRQGEAAPPPTAPAGTTAVSTARFKARPVPEAPDAWSGPEELAEQLAYFYDIDENRQGFVDHAAMRHFADVNELGLSDAQITSAIEMQDFDDDGCITVRDFLLALGRTVPLRAPWFIDAMFDRFVEDHDAGATEAELRKVLFSLDCDFDEIDVGGWMCNATDGHLARQAFKEVFGATRGSPEVL